MGSMKIPAHLESTRLRNDDISSLLKTQEGIGDSMNVGEIQCMMSTISELYNVKD